ncbi:hypothetical protein J6590_012096 [Homalodisca vitripennis]|nr:hypothetical protein J6590_012096 [Homalodisca vitripennis]
MSNVLCKARAVYCEHEPTNDSDLSTVKSRKNSVTLNCSARAGDICQNVSRTLDCEITEEQCYLELFDSCWGFMSERLCNDLSTVKSRKNSVTLNCSARAGDLCQNVSVSAKGSLLCGVVVWVF